MPRWTQEKIQRAQKLRATGHTLTEICKILESEFGPVAYGRVWDYIKDIPIEQEYRERFELNRNTPTIRSSKKWGEAGSFAEQLFSSSLTQREMLLVSAMLYWSEGTKRSFDIVNGDPLLLRCFKKALQYGLNIPNERFTFSLILYEDLDSDLCVNYWANTLDLENSQLRNISRRKGAERGKLRYGICRLRIIKADNELKRLLSIARATITAIAPIAQTDRAPDS